MVRDGRRPELLGLAKATLRLGIDKAARRPTFGRPRQDLDCAREPSAPISLLRAVLDAAGCVACVCRPDQRVAQGAPRERARPPLSDGSQQHAAHDNIAYRSIRHPNSPPSLHLAKRHRVDLKARPRL